MTVTQTSREAYMNLDTQDQKQRVLETIDGHAHSGSCISNIKNELKGLGIYIDSSSVSARMNELKKEGLIVPASPFKRPSTGTGRLSEFWMHHRWKAKPGTQKTLFRGA